MKKLLMMVCVGVMVSMLAGCDDEETSRLAASSDGDYMDEEYSEEEYSEEEYVDEGESNGDLAAEIETFSDIYAGDYGNGNELLMAFKSDSNDAVIMIYNLDKQELSYFNAGTVSGDAGELQTVNGSAEYPFSFTIAEVTEDLQEMVVTFEEEDCGCTVNATDTNYFKEVCSSLGMM